MTTYKELQPIIRAPALGLSIDVIFETESDAPNQSRTGDRKNPYRWIHFSSLFPGSDYLTFAPPNDRLMQGLIECSIFGEPIGESGGLWDIAQDLETAYDGQSTGDVVFRHQLATLPQEVFNENDWLRLDWRLPFLWFKNE